jgi:hypothetical protein
VEVGILDEENRSRDPTPKPCEFTVAYVLEVKQRPNTSIIQELRWTLDPRRYYPHGCGLEHNSMHRVLRSLKEFDLIWFFTLRCADMFLKAA